MSAIATRPDTVFDAADGLLAWEDLEPSWQVRILGAIAESTTPPCFLAPPTPEALGRVLQVANQQGWSVLPCGRGTKLGWGAPVKSPQLVISTRSLAGAIEHAVGDLVVTVSAGTTLKALQEYLSPYRQFLPLDPAYADEATAGGIVAAADAGSWRQRYGGVRDLVLGIAFARSDGAIAKAGGRVVKNVAGYDLMKLLAGSYGTLGIITQITFRLYPLPESSRTLAVIGDWSAIADFVSALRASGFSPTAAEWLTPALTQSLDLGRDASVLLRFQTLDEVAAAQRQAVETLARSQSVKTLSLDGDREADLWQRWKMRMTDGREPDEILGKIGMAPQQMANVLPAIARFGAERGIASLNVGSGLGKLRLPASTSAETFSQLRAIAQNAGGFLTLLEAPTALKQAIEPWGFGDSGLDLMKKLKQKFDPQNILSPGRFF